MGRCAARVEPDDSPGPRPGRADMGAELGSELERATLRLEPEPLVRRRIDALLGSLHDEVAHHHAECSREVR